MYFYSHRVFWHFPEKGREETGWGKDRPEGEGDPRFPHSPPCLTTQGANTKREGRPGRPVLWKRLHEAKPTRTHKQAPLHTRGRQDYTEKLSTVGSRGRESNKVSSQTGGRPLPSPSCSIPKVSRVSPALLGHFPMASSFFPAAEDKKKKGTEQGSGWLKSIPQPLSLMPDGPSPVLSGKGSGQALSWPLSGRSRCSPGP